MANHKDEMSESEEMYLITIATLVEGGEASPIPLSRLAQELSVQPVSVNQMIKKLGDAGLVDYLPYKGAALTEVGSQKAAHILRHRRVWEVFLMDKLQLSISEADALACRMEHITPCAVIDRLSAFLGDPLTTSEGKQIPPHEGPLPPPSGRPLSEGLVGPSWEVIRTLGGETVLQFFSSAGITSGGHLQIVAKSEQSLLVKVGDEMVSLDLALAENIYVI